METSSRYGVSYPSVDRSDEADVPRDIAAIIVGLERSAMYSQGPLADLPESSGGSPGIQGRFYMATDQDPKELYYDHGLGWVSVNITLAHEITHLAGGSDALPWTDIIGSGTLAARPAAASTNAGYLYVATDTNGGTLYRSTGSAWAAVGAGISEAIPKSIGTTKGDIISFLSSGVPNRKSVGAAGSSLVAAPAQVDGLLWELAIGSDLASGATIAPVAKSHKVTGTTTIDNLTFGNIYRTTLIFQGTTTVRHNGGGTGNIRLVGGMHAGFVANETITLVYDGALWIEESRSPRHLSGEGGIIWNGAGTPSGLIAEDGSAISRTVYAAWFANVGTLYGVGDGSTTVNVADTRGRVDVGYAASGGHSDVSTIGNNDGVAATNRRSTHNSSVTDPGHSHALPSQTEYTDQGNLSAATNQTTGSGALQRSTDSATTGVTVGPGGTAAIDTPSYIVRPKFTRI